MEGSPAGTMKLVGRHPALDFVNTVGGRAEAGSPLRVLVTADKLVAYPDLLDWARHAGLLGESAARELAREAGRRPREAKGVLGRATRLRESLYRILRSAMDGRAPDPGDLGVVNVELGALRRRERLVPGPDGLRWEAASGRDRLDSVLLPVARAAEALLTSGGLDRLRQCGGEGCGWLFLDQSRNHRRRWCTMEDCGNLAKVRRFRRRWRRGGT